MEGTKTVQEILKGIGLEKFTDNFIKNDIDATTFLTLSKEDLELVIPGKLGPQKKIVQEIQRIRDLRIKKPGHLSTSLQGRTLQSPKVQLKSSAAAAKIDPIQRRKAIGRKHRNACVIEMKEKKDDTKKPLSKGSAGVSMVAAIAGPICISLIQRSIISKITAPSVKKLLHGEDIITVDVTPTNLLPGEDLSTVDVIPKNLLHGEDLSTVDVTPTNLPEATNDATDLSSLTTTAADDKNICPAFDCPFSVQRLGKLGDGGKWICGIEVFEHKQNCVVYSFGINKETTFENEVLERTPCEIFAFDGSVDEVVKISSQHSGRVHFSKLFGGAKSINQYSITLGEAMRRNQHGWIDILKMDVESSEFEMFKQITEEFLNNGYLPFGQLQLEIHARLNEKQDNKAELNDLFEMLEKAGLRPFRNELNLGPIVQRDFTYAVSEYSFININRFC